MPTMLIKWEVNIFLNNKIHNEIKSHSITQHMKLIKLQVASAVRSRNWLAKWKIQLKSIIIGLILIIGRHCLDIRRPHLRAIVRYFYLFVPALSTVGTLLDHYLIKYEFSYKTCCFLHGTAHERWFTPTKLAEFANNNSILLSQSQQRVSQ
jgi:hypothetical protein